MKISMENVSACRKVLRIEVPEDVVDTEYGQVIKLYAKSAKIPGFRAGKTPGTLIEKRYRKEIEKDTRDRLVPRYYQEALSQEKISPISVISVSDGPVTAGQPLVFDVTLDVTPEVTLPTYKGLSLAGEAVAVSDEQVDQAFSELRDRYATYEEVAGRTVLDADYIRVDYEGRMQDELIADKFPDSTRVGGGSDFWIMLGGPEFIPGLGQGLVGAAIDETREIDVSFPDDFTLSDLAGQLARYTATVRAIREKRMPENDDDLLKVAGVESIDALKERLRGEITAHAESQEKGRLKNELADLLLKKADVALPESLVQREQQRILQNIVRENMARGVSRDEIETQKDQLFSAAESSSQNRVKLSFILAKIGEEESIAVADDEVRARIEQIAQGYGESYERVKAQFENEEAMAGLRDDLLMDKVLDFLLENAKIKT